MNRQDGGGCSVYGVTLAQTPSYLRSHSLHPENGSTDDSRPGVDEVDDAVAVERHILLRDHFDGLLCYKSAQESGCIG